MNCPECGASTSETSARCEHCGTELATSFTQTSIDIDQDDAETEQFTSRRGKRGPQSSKTANPMKDAPTEFVGETSKRKDSGSSGSASGSSPAASLDEATLTSGTVFSGRYEILDLIGRGGMGLVYKARDVELDRVIALKTIRGQMGRDPEVVQRFKQELVLARKITHKNVIRIYDFGEADGIKFFTMEYVEGRSLKELIRERHRFTAVDTVAIARQILSALQEAHDQGVVHRDLKPQNIIVDKPGHAYIMDFGIARSTDSTGLTATGVMIGTPDYMSPEQVRAETADQRSDIFSFGVILYEMLTGDLPYHGDTLMSKVMVRLTKKPRAPRQISLEIPKYLEQVILKSMELEPEFRYQSANDVLADLDREQVDVPLTPRIKRAVKRRQVLLAAVVAAVLAAGAVTFVMRGRSAVPPEPVPVADIPVIPVTTVAILPFTNAASSEELDWLRHGLPQMLVTDISQSKFVRPVAAERVLETMRELGVESNTRFDEATLNAIAERAPAQSILYGQYVESGGELRMDLTLRSSESRVPVPLQAEGVAADIFGLVDEITTLVKDNLDVDPDLLEDDIDRPIADVSTASLEAVEAYQSGLEQMRDQEIVAAVPYFVAATQADSRFAMAHTRLAEAHAGLGQVDDAEAAIEIAIELTKDNPLPLAERHYIHATHAFIKNDFETAVASYQELAALYPEDPDIQMRLALSLEEGGNLPQALEAYGRALEMTPESGQAIMGMARMQWYSGDAEQAIASLLDAIDQDYIQGPESLGRAHGILGGAYRDTAQLDKAEENLKLSLDLQRETGAKGNQISTLVNLASVYEFQGNIDAAISSAQEAITLAEEIGDRGSESYARLNLGITQLVAGRLDEALEQLRDSLEIEREREDLMNMPVRLGYIAEVYFQKGQYEDAMVYLEQAKTYLDQTQEPNGQAFTYISIGKVRKAQGLYDESIEAFLEALPIFQEIGQDMGVAMGRRYLGEVYIEQGRYADAHEALDAAMKMFVEVHADQDIAEAQVPIARLLTDLAQVEAADAILSKTEKEAIAPDMLLIEADLLNLTGRLDEAAEAYESANVQANLSGRKEVAVLSRIALGRLYLVQGKLQNAERLLTRTRAEAEDVRLRPLQAEAATALAEVHLAKNDFESARRQSSEAIDLAERFSGRPILYRAHFLEAEALSGLGRSEEALASYAESASTLDWIRGGTLPEHVPGFMGRRDVQTLLTTLIEALEDGGRGADAEPLKPWVGASQPGDAQSP